jgi:hypothetical protein
MKNITYRRGQIEWALWQFFCIKPDARIKPPDVFVKRIKRLLELDRAKTKKAPGFAFSEFATHGQGNDATFTAFDTFCLGVALEQLDAGFKQSEIIIFLSYIRKSLFKEFESTKLYPHSFRLPVAADDYPKLPSYEENNNRYVDPRIFMVTSKFALKEVFPKLRNTGKKEHMILKPDFFHGIEEFSDNLNKHFNYFRKVSVFELSEMAKIIRKSLEDAPEIRRGRS